MDTLDEPQLETRDRLLHAAMEVFAEQGYEGASTRDLAQRAGVALSAIPYHFGGKGGLYTAVAEHAAEIQYLPLRAPLEQAAACANANPTAAEAGAALETLVTTVAHVMLAPGSSTAVASQFSVRELINGGPAFKIIFGTVIDPIVSAATSLLAIATGRDQSDEEVRIQAATLFGPITNFRVLYNTSLGSMSEVEAIRIQQVICDMICLTIRALIHSKD
jgi:AcrR family transcriptional regulator